MILMLCHARSTWWDAHGLACLPRTYPSHLLELLKFCCMEDTNPEAFWLLNRMSLTFAEVPVCLALKLVEVQETWYYSRKSC